MPVLVSRSAGADDAAARADHHDHAAPFHHGPLFDHGDVADRLDDLIEHRLPGLRVDNLAAAKDDDELALVPLGEEPADVLHLEVEVVLVGLRAELDLLEHDRRLVLARSLLLLRRLVLELPEVHDLADRRNGPRIDFDQLEPGVFRQLERFLSRDDADLRAVGADDTDLGHSDATANAVVVGRAWRSLIEWPWDDLSPGSRWLGQVRRR